MYPSTIRKHPTAGKTYFAEEVCQCKNKSLPWHHKQNEGLLLKCKKKCMTVSKPFLWFTFLRYTVQHQNLSFWHMCTDYHLKRFSHIYNGFCFSRAFNYAASCKNNLLKKACDVKT